MENGEDIFGLILIPQTMPIGDAIADLELIITYCEETEFVNRIQYLPL